VRGLCESQRHVLNGKVQTINSTHVLVAAPASVGIRVPLSDGLRVSAGDEIGIAVRRDDIELLRPGGTVPPAGTASITSRAQAIEYQGYFVKVAAPNPPVGSQVHEPNELHFMLPRDRARA
jgi:putative spermidine/putrescine transport system ATP-binding protein